MNEYLGIITVISLVLFFSKFVFTLVQELAKNDSKKQSLYMVITVLIISLACFILKENFDMRYESMNKYLYDIETQVNYISDQVDDSYIGIEDSLRTIYNDVMEIYKLTAE